LSDSKKTGTPKIKLPFTAGWLVVDMLTVVVKVVLYSVLNAFVRNCGEFAKVCGELQPIVSMNVLKSNYREFMHTVGFQRSF
jgi:hypothetical protein